MTAGEPRDPIQETKAEFQPNQQILHIADGKLIYAFYIGERNGMAIIHDRPVDDIDHFLTSYNGMVHAEAVVKSPQDKPVMEMTTFDKTAEVRVSDIQALNRYASNEKLLADLKELHRKMDGGGMLAPIMPDGYTPEQLSSYIKQAEVENFSLDAYHFIEARAQKVMAFAMANIGLEKPDQEKYPAKDFGMEYLDYMNDILDQMKTAYDQAKKDLQNQADELDRIVRSKQGKNYQDHVDRVGAQFKASILHSGLNSNDRFDQFTKSYRQKRTLILNMIGEIATAASLYHQSNPTKK